ncbi:MAG: ABC transporter ATP-binding protein [Bacillota bacterium]
MSVGLKVKGLYFSYGKENILNDLDLTIDPGSFVCIVGPNGSGKSTLLKNISKALLPGRGEIRLGEYNLLSLRPKQVAQQMAVVPQDTHIEFAFTVYETVLMGRTPFMGRFQSEGPKDFALARWAMEITNTWHLRDRPVTEISGGERQRVVVARALAQEPRIILLDEPTAHLDIQHQMELLELLQSLNKTSGLTVVAVLHDLNLAAHFSEYVVLMKDGRIFAEGEPQRVLSSENIRDVYGMEVAITDNPFTGRFNIIPLGRSKAAAKNGRGVNVHLVCGGGTGIFLLDRLTQLGYRVSCGVLNIGDTDWSRAKALGVQVAEEAPFASISNVSARKNRTLMERSHCIILTSIPFGMGNLVNLELSLEALKQGKHLLVISNGDFDQRDFTKGKAGAILEEIKKNGGKIMINPQEVFSFLDEVRESLFPGQSG